MPECALPDALVITWPIRQCPIRRLQLEHRTVSPLHPAHPQARAGARIALVGSHRSARETANKEK